MSEGVLVLKFGGAALAAPARVRLAARRVRGHLRLGRRVVAVVSAAGHTTDRILRWADAVGGTTSAAAREVDRALATGEDLSAGWVAAALIALGVPAESLRGGEAGLEAEGAFGAGVVRRVDPGVLNRFLERGVVPVVTGFQARRSDGETLTLGRGGSDVSAVHIAAALGARACHLVKDVEGIFSADPRLDPAAERIAALSHDALVEIAERGAQVVHPAAARVARAERVPLEVYHFRAPLLSHGGTRIGGDDGARDGGRDGGQDRSRAGGPVGAAAGVARGARPPVELPREVPA